MKLWISHVHASLLPGYDANSGNQARAISGATSSAIVFHLAPSSAEMASTAPHATRVSRLGASVTWQWVNDFMEISCCVRRARHENRPNPRLVRRESSRLPRASFRPPSSNIARYCARSGTVDLVRDGFDRSARSKSQTSETLSPARKIGWPGPREAIGSRALPRSINCNRCFACTSLGARTMQFDGNVNCAWPWSETS